MMNNKHVMKPVTLVAGAALAATLAAAPAQADVNPFGMSALASGYMVADAKGTEGKCGEAKCGADKAAAKASEGECGANKKSDEGKCGSNKATAKPIQEAKCGEAKCGSSK